jgi:hypothetical protein
LGDQGVGGADSRIKFTLLVAGTTEFGPVGLDPHAETQQPAAAQSLVGRGHPVESILDHCVGLLQLALPDPQLGQESCVLTDMRWHASHREGP